MVLYQDYQRIYGIYVFLCKKSSNRHEMGAFDKHQEKKDL